MNASDLQRIALAERASSLADRSIAALFHAETDRLARFSVDAAGVHADFSRQAISREDLDALLAFARAMDIEGRRDAMLAGAPINVTEQRRVLHTALRRDPARALAVDGRDLMPAVAAELSRMAGFAEAVRAGRWRGAHGHPVCDVVSIGIGGSHLGPLLACEALAAQGHRRLRLHFLSNIDPGASDRLLAQLDPARTLFAIASKSWRTSETARNAGIARRWLQAAGIDARAQARHLVGVTANAEGARATGLSDDCIFGFEDWVGGRFSLWSAIGLPVMIQVGAEAFGRLLAGARAMDEHFARAPLAANAPVLLALVSLWNRMARESATQAVIPYSDALRRLPAWLQQLEMESNGKSVDLDGRPLHGSSAAVVWGEAGTDAQHSFFQALHQGTTAHPVEFVLAVPPGADPESRDIALLANALAQADALMHGRTLADSLADLLGQGMPEAQAQALAPHRVHPGNRPSTTLLLERLDPERLGALLALYEHRTAVLGWLWNLNSFDQWGVELGKQLAAKTEALLRSDAPPPATLDPSGTNLLTRVRAALANRG